MGRRHHSSGSGLEAFVVDRHAADRLSWVIGEILQTLTPLRRQVLVDVIVNNLPVGQIATKHGISNEKVRAEFSRAISNLRHPSRSQHLAAYSTEDEFFGGEILDAQILRHLLAGSAFGVDGVTVEWVKCDLHGMQHIISTAAKCHGCPCELPRAGNHLAETGRPRKYCSDACRQRAYRQRRG